jgi:hypothetical protein
VCIALKEALRQLLEGLFLFVRAVTSLDCAADGAATVLELPKQKCQPAPHPPTPGSFRQDRKSSMPFLEQFH